MNLVQNEIVEGFNKIGLKKGSIVLVHSSLRSFGYVEGGANTVIKALLETVGNDGVAMVPTLTGKYTNDKYNPPIFDVRKTPCITGEIPENFRHMPEAKRSLHPTHSVTAIGSRRDELLFEHETGKSPCDKKSPYFKNAMLDGYVMLIGVDQESNTTIHCCEEIAGVPYHLQRDITEINIVDYSGNKISMKNNLHDWYKPPTDFNKFDALYLFHGIMKKIKIGNSNIRLIKARDMIEFSVDILIREPFFLVKRIRL